MPDIRSQPQWSFFVYWVLVNIVGFGVGFGAGQAVFEVVARTVHLDGYQAAVGLPMSIFVAGVAMFTIFGVSIGITQWLVLRRHIRRAGWWVLATILGPGVALSLITIGDAVAAIPSIAIVFLAIGVAQWFVLRRYIPRAGWWVLTSAVGFALALVVFSVVFGVLGTTAGFSLGGPLSGAVYGVITGRALELLLGQPIPEAGS